MNILQIDNKYITRLVENNSNISEDSLLTLSRKSSKMTENQALIQLLPNFQIEAYSNSLEVERRNPFIFDNKQEQPTISYLDVVDGSQHEVTLTTDPQWIEIESLGQLNKCLVELLGVWKGLQFKYEVLQELFDNGDERVKKSQVRIAKREYRNAQDRFFREQTKEQTKIVGQAQKFKNFFFKRILKKRINKRINKFSVKNFILFLFIFNYLIFILLLYFIIKYLIFYY